MISYQNGTTSIADITSGHYSNYPEYSHQAGSENCQALAKKVNKQFNGSSYCLITEPENYIERYKQRISQALNSTDPDECALACSGNYDLCEITRPRISDGKLVFFVHRNSKEFPTPCRVTCENPSSPHTAKITCECLPYIK